MPQEYKEYVKEKGVADLFEKALEKLKDEQPADPVSFFAKYFTAKAAESNGDVMASLVENTRELLLHKGMKPVGMQLLDYLLELDDKLEAGLDNVVQDWLDAHWKRVGPTHKKDMELQKVMKESIKNVVEKHGIGAAARCILDELAKLDEETCGNNHLDQALLGWLEKYWDRVAEKEVEAGDGEGGKATPANTELAGVAVKAEEAAAEKAEEKADEEAAKKADEAKRAEDEAAKKAEEEAAKKAEEAKRAEDEAAKKAEEEAAKKVDEESKQAEEGTAKKVEEKTEKKAEEGAKADEEPKKAEEEGSKGEAEKSAVVGEPDKKGHEGGPVEEKAKEAGKEGKGETEKAEGGGA